MLKTFIESQSFNSNINYNNAVGYFRPIQLTRYAIS